LPNDPSAASATFSLLRQPVFRMLWLVWLAANMTMWMSDIASAWLMISLTDNALIVAMVQAASTLPVFLLGLPSGALADIVDRRRFFALTQVWACLVAILLAVFSFVGALSVPLLLALTFANGITMAMRWPVFAAIVPQVVPRQELSAALALNAMAANMSRLIGPVLAGTLLAGAGSTYVFLLNAGLSALACVLILRWRSEPKIRALRGERFPAAMRVGVQHVKQSPRMRIILMRIFLFFVQATSLTALLPLVALQMHGEGPGTFTVLLAAMGAGALMMAVNIARLHFYIGREAMVYWGICIHAAAATVVVLSPTLWLSGPAMAVAGMAWIGTANSLTVAAQLALPDWVRARGMSIYQMAVMGGSATGAIIWGYVANQTSVSTSVISAAFLGPCLLLLTRHKGAGGHIDEDLRSVTPRNVAPAPVIAVAPEDGPVMVTIAYVIDPASSGDFIAVMQQTRLARLRQGVISWELFRDASQAAGYIEYFLDENWIEHQRRMERFTAADIDLRKRRLAFHIGTEPPETKRYIGQLVGSVFNARRVDVPHD
jgi:MFS family permease